MSSTIYLSIAAGWLRAILRAYFTLAFLLIGFLGTRCLSYRSQRSISSQKQIPVTEMTGWLSGLTLLDAIKSFHGKFPGGYLFGTYMLLCSLFNLISDLAVSGFVQNVTIAGRCNFDTGLVIPSTFQSDGWWSVPPNNGAPYFAVAQAQLKSLQNGGLVGIYWKVNRDLNFRADNLDVACQWNCTGAIQTKLPSLLE